MRPQAGAGSVPGETLWIDFSKDRSMHGRAVNVDSPLWLVLVMLLRPPLTTVEGPRSSM